ncbi:hypothetical protein J2Y67_001790 [Neobacillus niacini]|nr:hypothetical protein [Neobacillus niacini]
MATVKFAECVQAKRKLKNEWVKEFKFFSNCLNTVEGL